MIDENADFRNSVMEKFKLSSLPNSHDASPAVNSNDVLTPNIGRFDSLQALALHEEALRKENAPKAKENTVSPLQLSLSQSDSMEDLIQQVLEHKKGESANADNLRSIVNEKCVDTEIIAHLFGQ